MSHVIRIVGLAAAGFPDEDSKVMGKWIKSFDVDANDGRGEVKFTTRAANAMQFSNAADAWEAWRSQSKTRPLRPDGKPNRPLTAYSVDIHLTEAA